MMVDQFLRYHMSLQAMVVLTLEENKSALNQSRWDFTRSIIDLSHFEMIFSVE